MGRMTKAITPKGESEYSYNGLGHRVGMKEHDHQFNPGKQVEYILDLTKDYNNLLQKREQGEVQTYLWDRELVGVKNSMTAEEEIEEANQGSSYYLVDELGSPLRLKGAGNLSINETYGYDEFGKDLYDNQTKTQPFSFTGYQKDESTGLHYAQARYYDGNLGRFTGQDVIKGNIARPDTLNEYKYCLNNPMKYVDRDGRLEEGDVSGVESDIVYAYYLNAEKGAFLGLGHAAVLFEFEDGTGFYYNNAANGDVIKRELTEEQMKTFFSAGIIYDSETRKDIDNSAKSYDRYIRYSITDEQGEKMVETAERIEKKDKKYNLLFNNCSEFAEEVIESGIVVNKLYLVEGSNLIPGTIPLGVIPNHTYYYLKITVVNEDKKVGEIEGSY